jgi:excisionase family DNA binding protein
MATNIVSKNEFLTGQPASRVSPEPEVLLTVHEVAEILKVPTSRVYERTRRRGVERLPHLKVGKYLRFRLSEIEQYLEKFAHD